MAEETGISWTTHTWSPWVGCQAVSPACDGCYAEALTERWGGDFSIRRRTSPAYWKQLAKWNAVAEKSRRRAHVFPSMCDPFDNKAPEGAREDFWAEIRRSPWLIFQLLTKRPQNMRKMLPPDWGHGYPNVWLGTTIENQEEAVRRMPHFLAVPAELHFISAEPLLEPVNLTSIQLPAGLTLNGLTGYYQPTGPCGIRDYAHRLSTVPTPIGQRVRWLIVGGESGPGARPMRPEWAASLLRQCRESDTLAWFKQTGAAREDWPGVTKKGDDPAQWPPEFRVQEMPR